MYRYCFAFVCGINTFKLLVNLTCIYSYLILCFHEVIYKISSLVNLTCIYSYFNIMFFLVTYKVNSLVNYACIYSYLILYYIKLLIRLMVFYTTTQQSRFVLVPTSTSF